MGEVYRARDTRLGREVAVKVLPPEMAGDAARLERFRREARTVAALSHPNIVTLYSVEEGIPWEGSPGPVHLLTMELIRGETLAAFLPGNGLSLPDLLDIAVPMADAVATAHDQGVIHRDLKPANVMRDRSGRVCVLDFGLAALRAPGAGDASPTKEAATVPALTGEGQILGTVAYMAPEQLEGRPADPRSDVFALGVILYEMAAGTPPFRAESTAGLASAILRDEPPPLAERRPDLPPDLFRIIRRCLHKDPERRFQTAKDVRNELEELRRGGGPSAGASAPAERRFVLTTDLVRGLSRRVPRMVGDAMTYLDNGTDSDVLVVYLPAIGLDHRMFEPVLRETPYRGVAPSLFGFGPEARLRPALSLEDHNRILVALVEDLGRRLRPRTTVLVGVSAGGDQALRLVASEAGANLKLDGLLVLGPNVSLEAAFASRRLAELRDDPAQRLSALKSMGAGIDSLPVWLAMHEYLVQTFRKFGPDLSALVQYARDVVAPLEADPDAFYRVFRAALDRVPHVRCVFAEEESGYAEEVLARHLDEDVPGGRFTEDVVRIAAVDHLNLSRADVLAPLVTEVVERAKAAPLPAPAERTGTGGTGREIRSLAVLPLDNLSGDPEQDYFADGMTEAITAQVAKVGKLRVISRTTVMQYKGTRKPLPQIARELKVDAIVEGSVLRAGDRVRITVQLIDAAADEHLWAETYDRDLSDVLELQSEVSGAIVERIQNALTPQQKADLAAPRRIDPAAYEAYLKGRFHWNQRTTESLREGLTYFQKVIEREPTYALAYVGIAECHNVLGFQAVTPAKDSFAPAVAAARKALEIDPSLAEAHVSLGYASIHYDFDFKNAEAAFGKGLELNPGYPTGHHWYALYLTNMGRRDEALAAVDTAWELDPLAPIIRTARGWINYMFREYDTAIGHYRNILGVHPDFWAARHMLGNTYAMKGMFAEAVAEFRIALNLAGNRALSTGSLGYALAASGDAEGAHACLADLHALSRKQYVRPYETALIHTALGETEPALDDLERAYRERGNWLNYLGVDPAFDSLRREPRFRKLLQRVFGQ
jgi:TolB-like protein/Flp pilus assembly protein TadD